MGLSKLVASHTGTRDYFDTCFHDMRWQAQRCLLDRTHLLLWRLVGREWLRRGDGT
jgi:hypothetical protein